MHLQQGWTLNDSTATCITYNSNATPHTRTHCKTRGHTSPVANTHLSVAIVVVLLLQLLHARIDAGRRDARRIERLPQMDNGAARFHHRVALVVLNQLAERAELFAAADVVLLLLPADHHVRHLVLGAHRQHKVARFALRFAHQKRAVLAALEDQPFRLLAGQVAVEPAAGEWEKTRLVLAHLSMVIA